MLTSKIEIRCVSKAQKKSLEKLMEYKVDGYINKLINDIQTACQYEGRSYVERRKYWSSYIDLDILSNGIIQFTKYSDNYYTNNKEYTIYPDGTVKDGIYDK